MRRGSFDSVAQLVRHIEAFIAHWNENPTPFIWTKPASELRRRSGVRINLTFGTKH